MEVADRGHNDAAQRERNCDGQGTPRVKIPQVNYVRQHFDFALFDPSKIFPGSIRIRDEAVRQADHQRTKARTSIELVEAVTSEASQRERMATSARNPPVKKVAELADQNYIGSEAAYGSNQSSEDEPRPVGSVNLAHWHAYSPQHGLVITARAEVKEPHIDSSIE